MMEDSREEDRPLDTRDLVLSVLSANGGKIRGRTVLQKQCYFVEEMLGLRIEYEPYFYGPYSEDVAVSMDSLVALDFVEEESETLPTITAEEPQFDKRLYKYRLSEGGDRLVNGRKERLPIYGQVEAILDKLRDAGMNLNNANMLSVAAKTYHILKDKGQPLGQKEISVIAKELGWTIPDGLILEVAESLERAGLLKRVSNSDS